MKMRSSQVNLAVNPITLLIAFTLGGVLFGACDGGNEGDRCNPDLSHDDCSSGLTCQTPSTCVENVCCPKDPSTSKNDYCNGKSCLPVVDDAGATESASDASGD
jgi:hypothetical protein